MYYKEGFRQETLNKTIAARGGRADGEGHELRLQKGIKKIHKLI